jgi:ring-1,2-phenylacetyl-CoA epoxidase subunit PaaD
MVSEKEIYSLLEGVFDPEVPVLSIIDLGIVRSVRVENKTALIVITPTYIGCPAMQTIEKDIAIQLEANGISDFEVSTSEKGKQKLKAYGIAPPQDEADKSVLFADPLIVSCPKCDAQETKMISQFGSTACKAHYQCKKCQEPFDYFKCLR